MNIYIRITFSILAIAYLCSCSATSVQQVDSITFHPSKDFLKNAESMSGQEEDVIGRAVAARIFAAYKALSNQQLNNYLNRVGQTVVAASPRPETYAGYSFIVLDSDEINAMASPGGYIFITRGFLALLPDEDTLAAVLAHEITHVSKQHGLLAIKPGHFADYLQVGETFGSAVDCTGLSQQVMLAFKGAVADVFEALVVAGYSREQEYEADQGALYILEKAGYKPEALDTALKILQKYNFKGGWFKTHPKPSDRISAISDKIPQVNSAAQGYLLRKDRYLKAIK